MHILHRASIFIYTLINDKGIHLIEISLSFTSVFKYFRKISFILVTHWKARLFASLPLRRREKLRKGVNSLEHAKFGGTISIGGTITCTIQLPGIKASLYGIWLIIAFGEFNPIPRPRMAQPRVRSKKGWDDKEAISDHIYVPET